jgi:hypothetical protein
MMRGMRGLNAVDALGREDRSGSKLLLSCLLDGCTLSYFGLTGDGCHSIGLMPAMKGRVGCHGHAGQSEEREDRE